MEHSMIIGEYLLIKRIKFIAEEWRVNNKINRLAGASKKSFYFLWLHR